MQALNKNKPARPTTFRKSRSAGGAKALTARPRPQSARCPATLSDIPQATQVITAQLIEDQGARDVTDLYRNISGISFFSYAGVTFRGFRQEGTYYDGLRGDPFIGFSVPQLFNIERVVASSPTRSPTDDKVEVWAIPAKTGGSRAFCDRMNAWAQGQGQPGLGYIFWSRRARGSGPIAKNIGEERTAAIRSQLGLEDGDAVFFVAGGREDSTSSPAKRAPRSALDLNLIDRNRFELCWIVDFPFYEWRRGRKEDRLRAQPVLDAAGRPRGARTAPTRCRIKAYQYDAVCNGFEIASGSIRNQQPETMVKAFELAGLSRAGRRGTASAASIAPSSTALRRMAALRLRHRPRGDAAAAACRTCARSRCSR